MSVNVNGVCTMDVLYSEGKIISVEDLHSETIEVRTFPTDVPLARVTVSRNLTINMGDFESVKLGVSVELPTPMEQLDEAYEAAKSFADMRLNKEAAEVRVHSKR